MDEELKTGWSREGGADGRRKPVGVGGGRAHGGGSKQVTKERQTKTS